LAGGQVAPEYLRGDHGGGSGGAPSARTRSVLGEILMSIFSWMQHSRVDVSGLATNVADYAGSQVPQYSKLELTFDVNNLSTTFPTTGGKFTDPDLNPYNPLYVDVEGVFSPPGDNFGAGTLTVPGFWYQDFTITDSGGTVYTESVTAGASHWKIRFAPVVAGVYQYYIKVLEYGIERYRTAVGTFTAVASANPGFMRRNATNPYAFSFDNGQAFNPVGLSLPPNYSVAAFGSVFDALVANNMTITRFTEGTSFFKLEWKYAAYGGQFPWYSGLGIYNPVAAYRLDQVIALAETHNLQLSSYWGAAMEFNHSLTGYNFWPNNPYNAANGGPCTVVYDIFSNETAKAYLKRRLRYFISRFSYSPALFNWGALSEIDWLITHENWHSDAAKWPVINAWNAEMTAYIKSLDIYGHLNSGSTGVPYPTYYTLPQYEYWRQYWNLSCWDFINEDLYRTTVTDYIPCHFDTLVDTLDIACNDPDGGGAKTMPPHYGLHLHFGEWAQNGNYTETALHEALWIATLNGGSLMPWYYTVAAVDNNWLPRIKALALFMAGENLGTNNLRRVRLPACTPVGFTAYTVANTARVLGYVLNSGAAATGTVTLTGMTPGTYTVELWEPWAGTLSGTSTVTVTGSGVLVVPLTTVTLSIAFKAYL
jgi:hypothetical protein